MADYFERFHEKFGTQKLKTFVKLKKQNVVYAREFFWFIKKVVGTTYVVLVFFGSPTKCRKY